MPRQASITSDVIGRLVEIAGYDIGAGVISKLLTMLEIATKQSGCGHYFILCVLWLMRCGSVKGWLVLC